MRITFFIFLFFFFNSCQLLPSKKEITQKPMDIKEKPPKKIKLGLFISGGGANTFSSIPILELLHREKIHFDFIAGTGWGAWIAASYAKNQSVNELKWNLFKLQEKNIFERRWFDNIKKRSKLLKNLTEEILSAPLKTSFLCPALDKQGHILWLRGNSPTQAVLSCLNLIPPFLFSFNNIRKQGSLFSAESTMKIHLETRYKYYYMDKTFFSP